MKYAIQEKDSQPISIDEAARRIGVSREEVIDYIRRGKLATTTRLDEICVLWPEGAESAEDNHIKTDHWANPTKADDPKWLQTIINGSMIFLFGVAVLWLTITIFLSATRTPTTSLG
ncbi:MAG TPA: hypothetical protein VF681_05840 [Abditibacteriaceae bacterium]